MNSENILIQDWDASSSEARYVEERLGGAAGRLITMTHLWKDVFPVLLMAKTLTSPAVAQQDDAGAWAWVLLKITASSKLQAIENAGRALAFERHPEKLSRNVRIFELLSEWADHSLASFDPDVLEVANERASQIQRATLRRSEPAGEFGNVDEETLSELTEMARTLGSHLAAFAEECPDIVRSELDPWIEDFRKI